MRGNKILGIIFSHTQDDKLRELTDVRTTGSVPYGGRYRLIDFALSSMVNSGIEKVGVITKSNYQSLLDHLGSGKSWGLSRKNSGLFILPPFGRGNVLHESKVEALCNNAKFISHSLEDYVVLSDSDVIYSLDVQKVVDQHIAKGADITAVYKEGAAPEQLGASLMFNFNEEGNAESVLIDSQCQGTCNYGLHIYVMHKEFLLSAVKEAYGHNRLNFSRDIIAAEVAKGNVYGYKYTGYSAVIGSMKQYFDASMDLMKPEIRAELFGSNPVYTKIRDEMPAVYGLGSEVENSLIADGCQINGYVENSILFRGVTVGAGAVVRNCIVMQDTSIGENTKLNYVVVDKDNSIGAEREFAGEESYPVYIRKGSLI
ncbi:MAG: glucose-1-phosphate adenylyltransferase subunit GlgD [Oscillospiraceae bacterium]|jgi:glucose-1-phosphate adenylyltransferase|nr:glucose-1-phosphate adenylyltransferase subunit GlgD [Oscillospiraceae bacterium]